MKLGVKRKVRAYRNGGGGDQEEGDGQEDGGRQDHQAQYSSTPLVG